MTPSEHVQAWKPSPGRFEGEPPETSWYWDRSLDGDGDEVAYMQDGTGVYACILTVEDDERAAFGFSPETVSYVVEQSDQGFVYGRALTAQDEEEVRAHYAALNTEEEE